MAQKLSIDLTEDGPFRYVAWAGGAIGGGAALAMTSAATLGGLATAAVTGMFIGGVAVPAACLGIVTLGASIYDAKKEAWNRKGEIAAMTAIVTAISGLYMTGALFFSPLGVVIDGIRKLGGLFKRKPQMPSKPAEPVQPPSVEEIGAKPALTGTEPAKDFEAAKKPKRAPIRQPTDITDIPASPGLTD